MIDRVRHLCLMSLATACIAGCGTTSPGKESWAYVGKDPMLRSPPNTRVGNASDPAWRLEAEAAMATWNRLQETAIGSAKEACVRETGESGTPNLWTGYSAPFMACMKARGWLCCFSNPL